MWLKYALFALLLMFIKLVLLITFLVHFLKTFSTDLKSAWNSAFIDTFFDFFKQNFVGHMFLQILKPNLQQTAPKLKIFCVNVS